MSGVGKVAAAAATAGLAAAGPLAPDFRPFPERGRVFTSSRLVRRADAAPSGRLRFDAIARYLQDVAEDDVAGTGWQAPYEWLLRRCAIVVRGYPSRGELVNLTTFCSATGPRWAERTTTVTGTAGDLMQATAVWVAVDRDSGRPAELGAEFLRWYGTATCGRQVSARLSLPAPPAGLPDRPWPLRASDLDAAGHVGNTIHWAAAEDAIAGLSWLPASAILEYHHEILPGSRPSLVTARAGDELSLWLCNGDQRLASGVLSR